MKHKHSEFLHALADGRADEFECRHETCDTDKWCAIADYVWLICEYPDFWTTRRAMPRTIRIGNLDVPEPMRIAPEVGTAVWLVCTHTDLPFRYSWSGNTTEQEWLKAGICQSTEQGAVDQRRAMILAVGGTP